MCGAHAQVMPAAEISVGVRVEGITRAHVRNALWETRGLVKTIGPRGTVHLFPAADLATWNAVLAEALVAPNRPAEIRLSTAQEDAIVKAIDDALSEDELTLDELNTEIVRRAGAWAGERVMPAFQDLWPRWRQALVTAAIRGVLCFGPNRGQKVTYASPRRWLGAYRPAPAGEAAEKVLHAYLHAYGPARPEHVAQWLGSTPAWAKRLFRRAENSLEPVVIEGVEAWQLSGDEDAGTDAAGVWLLPYFDAYAVGCHPRRELFPGRAAARVLSPSGGAGNYPLLLMNGIVAGVWHQRRSGRKTEVTVEPFGRLSALHRRELEVQVGRIGEIQEAAEIRLVIGPVSAGPHA